MFIENTCQKNTRTIGTGATKDLKRCQKTSGRTFHSKYVRWQQVSNKIRSKNRIPERPRVFRSKEREECSALRKTVWLQLQNNVSQCEIGFHEFYDKGCRILIKLSKKSVYARLGTNIA